MVKRYRWGFISLILLLILAACGGSSGGNPSSNTPPSSDGTTSSSESGIQKHTFSMLLVDHPNWPYNEDWVVWDWIEEKTGAVFDVQLPSGELMDTINLNVASDSMPDITFFLSRSEANKFGQQGVLANVLDYLDVMPNLKAWMEKYPDVTQATLAADGGMYMLPNQGFGETNRIIWMYRKDIFDKHGLETPKNYEELIAVGKRLKELYPNSYPFAFRSGANLEILTFASAQFDTHNDFYQDESGEVRYGPIEENYRKMVEMFHRMSEEGIIPPDWLTLSTQQWQTMVTNDQTFILLDYIGRLDLFNLPMQKENSEFHLAFMTPPEGVPGFAVNPYTHVLESGMTVSASSKQIKEIFKAYDWFYSEEGREILSWGKDDAVYITENGVRKLRPEYLDVTQVRKETGLATNGAYTWFDYDAHLVPASEEQKQAYELARKHDSVYRVKPQYNESELNEVTLLKTNIDKHRLEQITKFILGERNLAEWDAYVAEAKQLGLDRLTEITKDAYGRLNQ